MAAAAAAKPAPKSKQVGRAVHDADDAEPVVEVQPRDAANLAMLAQPGAESDMTNMNRSSYSSSREEETELNNLVTFTGNQGGTPVTTFLRQFESIAKEYNWSDQMKYKKLHGKLGGNARDMVDLSMEEEIRQRRDYRGLTQALIAAFIPSTSPWGKYDEMRKPKNRQADDERVREFHVRWCRTIEILNLDRDDQTLVQLFVQSLHPDLMQAVVERFIDKDPHFTATTMADVLSVALQKERVLATIMAARGNNNRGNNASSAGNHKPVTVHAVSATR